MAGSPDAKELMVHLKYTPIPAFVVSLFTETSIPFLHIIQLLSKITSCSHHFHVFIHQSANMRCIPFQRDILADILQDWQAQFSLKQT